MPLTNAFTSRTIVQKQEVVEKGNPYHDATGAFTSKAKARGGGDGGDEGYRSPKQRLQAERGQPVYLSPKDRLRAEQREEAASGKPTGGGGSESSSVEAKPVTSVETTRTEAEVRAEIVEPLGDLANDVEARLEFHRAESWKDTPNKEMHEKMFREAQEEQKKQISQEIETTAAQIKPTLKPAKDGTGSAVFDGGKKIGNVHPDKDSHGNEIWFASNMRKTRGWLVTDNARTQEQAVTALVKDTATSRVVAAHELNRQQVWSKLQQEAGKEFEDDHQISPQEAENFDGYLSPKQRMMAEQGRPVYLSPKDRLRREQRRAKKVEGLD